MNWLQLAILVVVLFFVWKLVMVVKSVAFKVIALITTVFSLWRLYMLFQIS